VFAGIAAAAVVVAGALAVTGIVGGSDNRSSTSSRVSASNASATTVDLSIGDVAADSAGAPATVSADDAKAVLAQLDEYVRNATVNPLRSGAPSSADLASVFDANTLTTATTTDRGVVFDEGLAKVTGRLAVTTTPISLLGLGDQTGKVTLVTASMVLDVKGATGSKDPLHILRKADFTFAPDATGAWKVTAYDIVVTRDGGGLAAPTTTQAAR
jgi:hypothetical protein